MCRVQFQGLTSKSLSQNALMLADAGGTFFLRLSVFVNIKLKGTCRTMSQSDSQIDALQCTGLPLLFEH